MTQTSPETMVHRGTDLPISREAFVLQGHDVFEITIRGLQERYRSGVFTIHDYVTFCLETICRLNPYLEAVIETNPDALSIARQLDDDRPAPHGPLHGIPVLIKDNMATQDRLQTTAGSWSLLGSRPTADADAVRRLRHAGAVILGKTNMDEWASVRSSVCSPGYSPRGGQTRNPYDLGRSPHGSSSGSAVAVAANLVPLALGTDTDTSVVGPAGVNGVVGIRPTVGRVAQAGVVPISRNMDVVGPLAREVADVALALDVVASRDEEAPWLGLPSKEVRLPFTSWLADREALKGARFGLPLRRFWDVCRPDCKALAARVLGSIKEAGASVIPVDMPSVDERSGPEGQWNWRHGKPETSEWTVAKVDAYNDIQNYLCGLLDTDIRGVEDIIAFNERNNGTEGATPGMVPAFPSGHDLLVEIAATKGREDETYEKALKHTRVQTRENGIDAALSYVDPKTGEKCTLDALLFCDRKGLGQQYAAQAGYPVVSIPIGLDDDGMPVALTLQHTAWKEAELIKWASAIEDLWRSKRGPRSTPTFRNILSKNVPIEEAGR